MRLLLTSAGVNNPSIRDSLIGLLGKPIDECTALCIPTAQYGHPHVGPGVKPWEFVSGREDSQMTQLGWKSVGLLELTALPSIDEEHWVPLVRETDVLLAAGGDSLYLCHWMRECGLADMLPALSETVWVGLSRGSMVMTPRIGKPFMGWQPPNGDDHALGLVEFAIYPHLDNPMLPSNTMANAEKWAAMLDCPAYAIDDDTAIRVVDGAVDVVSEGQWRRFDLSALEMALMYLKTGGDAERPRHRQHGLRHWHRANPPARVRDLSAAETSTPRSGVRSGPWWSPDVRSSVTPPGTRERPAQGV